MYTFNKNKLIGLIVKKNAYRELIGAGNDKKFKLPSYDQKQKYKCYNH